MQNTLELTQSEIKLIEIKRQQDALAAQEREAKDLARREKEIAGKKAASIAWMEKHAKQNRHAEFFFTELNAKYPGQYKLLIKPVSESFNSYDYVSDREIADHKPVGFMKGNYDIFNELTVNAKNFEIQHIASSRIIEVRIRPDHGYRMYEQYDHRDSAGCSRAKTIHEKVAAKWNAQQRQKTENEKQADREKQGPVLAKAMHPDATETVYSRDYHSYGRGYGYGRRNQGGYYTEKVVCTFKNGLKITYGISTNDNQGPNTIELSYEGVNTQGIKDKKKLIETLKSI